MSSPLLRPPPQLQAVIPYIKRGLQLQEKNALVAHKCKLFAMSVGLKFASDDPMSIAYLKELMKELERDRNQIGPFTEEDAKIQMESLAMSLYLTSVSEERSGRVSRHTFKNLRVVTVLMEALTQFGELSDEMMLQYNHSKALAASIYRNSEGRSFHDDASVSTIHTAGTSSPSPPDYSPGKPPSQMMSPTHAAGRFSSAPIRPMMKEPGPNRYAESPPEEHGYVANGNGVRKPKVQRELVPPAGDRYESNGGGGGGGGGRKDASQFRSQPQADLRHEPPLSPGVHMGDRERMAIMSREHKEALAVLERERGERQEDMEQLNLIKSELEQEREATDILKAELLDLKSENAALRSIAHIVERNSIRPSPDNPLVIKSDKLKVYSDRLIGVPGESMMIEAEWTNSKRAVVRAVAKIMRSCRVTEEQVVDLISYDHPNVVRYVHCEHFFDILGEYVLLIAERGDLSLGTMDGVKFLEGLRCPTRATLARDALAGLEYIHRRSRLHGSIKPSNIIVHVGINTRPVAKLGDTGIGCGGSCFQVRRQSAPAVSVIGAVGRGWAAPETIVGADDNASADIFGMGLVLSFILMGGQPPLVSDTELTFQGIGLDLSELVANGCWGAVDLIASMCCWNASERPNAVRALLHPFFWSPVQQLDFVALVGHIQRKPDDPEMSEEMRIFQDEIESSVNEYLGGVYDDGDDKRWSWIVVTSNEKQAARGAWDRAGVEPPTDTEARYHASSRRGFGLLRFVRNMWSRRAQLIKNGTFASESAVAEYVTLSLPWLVIEVFRLVRTIGLSCHQSLRPYFDGTALPSLEDTAKVIDASEPALTRHSDNSPFKSMARPSVVPGDIPTILDKSKWVRDDIESKCGLCEAVFGGFTRRHHCRLCGHLFCGGCSGGRLLMRTPDGEKKQRVCDVCASSVVGARSNSA